MEKSQCIICDEDIESPKVGVLYCDEKSCRVKYEKNMAELAEFESLEQIETIKPEEI